MFSKFKNSMGLLALSLVAILAIGCGSDNQDVFTATGPSQNAQVGNLSFAFQQVNPQVAGDVPQATTILRFDLFRSNPPSAESLVLTEVRPYAESIILENVPTDVVVVVVTALNGDRFPLVTLQGDAEVILGQTTPVDLGNAAVVTLDNVTVSPETVNVIKGGDPVQLLLTLGFSNGSVFQLPSFDAPEVTIAQTTEVANVTSTGQVSTGVGGETTTATATFTFGDQSASDDFTINTYCFDVSTNTSGTIFFPTSFVGGNMSMTQVFQVNAQTLIAVNPFDNGGFTVTEALLTGPTGVPVDVIADCAFALANAPVTGVTIDPATGVVTVDETAQDGSTITVIVTYVDEETGLTFTDSLDFTLVNIFTST